jgi:hypothetical protein
MKAEIYDGFLIITPESKTEEFAIIQWFEKQENNICTGEVKTKSLGYDCYKKRKTIKERFQLFALNHGFIR